MFGCVVHQLSRVLLAPATAAFAKAAQSVAEKTPRFVETVAKWQGVQLAQADPVRVR